MLEYIFFDISLRGKFVEYLRARGVEAELSDNDGFLVSIADDLDDELSDGIDAYYEVLLQENAALLEGTEDGLEKSAAGVRVQLADGTPCMVRLDPDLMARLLGCLGLEELRDMVQAIAEQVEDPDDRPLCHTAKQR